MRVGSRGLCGSARLGAVLVLLAACSGGGEPETAIVRGERVYQNVCAACHNGNPAQKGLVGPAIAGSSRELLYARVIEGRYPEGYEPKQAGGAMPKFPYLEDRIDDLAAYLQSVEPER